MRFCLTSFDGPRPLTYRCVALVARTGGDAAVFMPSLEALEDRTMPSGFGVLPPEINSGRIYAGPGSSPLVAAATAWHGLAAELQTAATSLEGAALTLSGEAWSGPSSLSTAQAVAPYVAWLSATATRLEDVAIQAQVVATDFENAFGSVAPPPVVAANRSQMMTLIATNILGQNAPAIAAAEAQYAEMWAQDIASPGR